MRTGDDGTTRKTKAEKLKGEKAERRKEKKDRGPRDHNSQENRRWEKEERKTTSVVLQVTASVPHESRYNYSGSRGSQNRAQRNGIVLY